uniref:Uncharacterized protein n=1 Tax=Setaria italica TaxID=4555 RepID=K3ZGN3_SETIT
MHEKLLFLVVEIWFLCSFFQQKHMCASLQQNV